MPKAYFMVRIKRNFIVYTLSVLKNHVISIIYRIVMSLSLPFSNGKQQFLCFIFWILYIFKLMTFPLFSEFKEKITFINILKFCAKMFTNQRKIWIKNDYYKQFICCFSLVFLIACFSFLTLFIGIVMYKANSLHTE